MVIIDQDEKEVHKTTKTYQKRSCESQSQQENEESELCLSEAEITLLAERYFDF